MQLRFIETEPDLACWSPSAEGLSAACLPERSCSALVLVTSPDPSLTRDSRRGSRLIGLLCLMVSCRTRGLLMTGSAALADSTLVLLARVALAVSLIPALLCFVRVRWQQNGFQDDHSANLLALPLAFTCRHLSAQCVFMQRPPKFRRFTRAGSKGLHPQPWGAHRGEG